MEQVTINNTPVVIDATPAIVNFNFEEMKAALETELEKYRVVVTADTVADAKKLATELNKTKGIIAKKRKEAVAEASEPVKQFEGQVKELEGMIETGRQDILTQVAKFEDETRELARKLLDDLRADLWVKHNIEAEFQNAEYEDLALLVTNVTKTGNLAAKAKSEIESRVAADKSLQDRTKMRLLELENQSYKAGLAAPLTRDHVAGFLFADDAQYKAELDRLMEAERNREEQARERQRHQHEQELARREAEIRAEEERKRQQEEARIRADEQAKAAQVRREQGEAERRAIGKCDGNHGGPRCNDPECWNDDEPSHIPDAGKKVEHNHTGGTNKKAEAGKVAVTITATFHTSVGPGVTDDQIAAELRRVMEQEGITTLSSIEVERQREAA